MNRELLLKAWDRLLIVLFYATLVLLFLRPSFLRFSTPLGSISLTSVKNISFLFCCAWFLAALAAPRRYFARCGLEAPLALILAAGCLSALLSRLGPASERWSAVLEYIFYCVFFYASLHLLRGPVNARGVVVILFVLAAIVAAADLVYHYRAGIWVILDADYPFWDGKNALGLYMVIALSAGASLLSPPRRGEKAVGEGTTRPRRLWRRVLVLPGMFLIFLNLVYSYSRGAWVAAAGATLTFGLLRSWKWIALLLAAMAALCFLPHNKAFHRFRSIPRMADGNVAKRLSVWKGASAMIASRPLTGYGPGEFRTAYDHYGSDPRRKRAAELPKEHGRYREHAHNLFLQVGAEAGVAAVGGLVWAIVVVLRAGLLRLRREPGDAVVKSALAALGAFLAFSLVDCSWTGRFSGSSFLHINLIVALLAAILLAQNTKYDKINPKF